MWVVGGLVIGLLVFLMIRRKVRKADKVDAFKGILLMCPSCSAHTDAAEGWVMSRPLRRLELIECSTCGKRHLWNMRVKPPVAK
jgi:hypothetical protein